MNSMNFKIPNTDELFANIIDEMWDKYDEDGNGYIDKDEFHQFMLDTFGDDLPDLASKNLGFERQFDEKEYSPDDVRSLTKSELDECFDFFDINRDKTVSKEEMIEILKTMTGL